MQKKCLFLILTMLVLNGHRMLFAQVDSVTVSVVSIINSDSLVKGLYRTFDEFRRNQPFYTDSFEIVRANSQNENPDFVDKVLFVLNGRERTMRADQFFGYSDGKDVYVAFWKFHPIKKLNHLSLIWVDELRQTIPNREFQIGISRTSTGARMSDNATDMKIEHLENWFVLDVSRGKIFSLSEKFITKKLERFDPELLRAFQANNIEHTEQTQLEFITKFNERNPIRF